ncbi:hypothetical protein E2542_SST21273 [Spatholobus suberectus]|nr:hypothetical protein E2542_SST21273 [Spatholobus suberectus]
MSAYGHQMEQMYSARSLLGGSELRRSSFVLESGFYITSFAATILVTALATVGLLLITILISLAMMLQSCQSSHAGIIELQNINDDYSYCEVYSLHAKLNNLEEHNFPISARTWPYSMSREVNMLETWIQPSLSLRITSTVLDHQMMVLMWC